MLYLAALCIYVILFFNAVDPLKVIVTCFIIVECLIAVSTWDPDCSHMFIQIGNNAIVIIAY